MRKFFPSQSRGAASLAYKDLQRIDGSSPASAAFVEHMGIDPPGTHILMANQFLNCSNCL